MASIIRRSGNGYRVTTRGSTVFVPKVGTGLYYSPELRGGGGGGSWSGGDLTVEGTTFTRKQMTYVVQIVNTVAQVLGEENPRDAQIAALICAIVETGGIWMYANSKLPESLALPHDKVGEDGLSVGLYQQQYVYGWGTIAQCMNVDYSTRSFLGGPDGVRNGASPSGLLDIDYKNYPTIGAAVQEVQVSAYPDRYDAEVSLAEALLDKVQQ